MMGTAAALAVAGLWMTCLANPGVIPAAHEPGWFLLLRSSPAPHTPLNWLHQLRQHSSCWPVAHAHRCRACVLADALVQQLDAGLQVPDRHLYSKDSRGVWMQRIGDGRTSATYSKYCSTCNVWCVAFRGTHRSTTASSLAVQSTASSISAAHSMCPQTCMCSVCVPLTASCCWHLHVRAHWLLGTCGLVCAQPTGSSTAGPCPITPGSCVTFMRRLICCRRPPRSHHCSICNACMVSRQCVWPLPSYGACSCCSTVCVEAACGSRS